MFWCDCDVYCCWEITSHLSFLLNYQLCKNFRKCIQLNGNCGDCWRCFVGDVVVHVVKQITNLFIEGSASRFSSSFYIFSLCFCCRCCWEALGQILVKLAKIALIWPRTKHRWWDLRKMTEAESEGGGKWKMERKDSRKWRKGNRATVLTSCWALKSSSRQSLEPNSIQSLLIQRSSEGGKVFEGGEALVKENWGKLMMENSLWWKNKALREA